MRGERRKETGGRGERKRGGEKERGEKTEGKKEGRGKSEAHSQPPVQQRRWRGLSLSGPGVLLTPFLGAGPFPTLQPSCSSSLRGQATVSDLSPQTQHSRPLSPTGSRACMEGAQDGGIRRSSDQSLTALLFSLLPPLQLYGAGTPAGIFPFCTKGPTGGRYLEEG